MSVIQQMMEEGLIQIDTSYEIGLIHIYGDDMNRGVVLNADDIGALIKELEIIQDKIKGD